MPDLPAGEDERLRLLAFSTPDLEALAAHLAAKGIAVTRLVAPAPAIAVSDPDGHPLAFVQRDWPPEARGPGPGARVQTPLSTRILHAGLSIRDEAAATRFYKDVLGFSEIWRGGRSEGVTDWINMRVPDGTDYLEYMLVSSPPDRRQRGVLHHVALLVPDIQAAWEAAGARTPAGERARLGPPNVGRNGRWQLNLYDTDGTRTELMEPFTGSLSLGVRARVDRPEEQLQAAPGHGEAEGGGNGEGGKQDDQVHGGVFLVNRRNSRQQQRRPGLFLHRVDVRRTHRMAVPSVVTAWVDEVAQVASPDPIVYCDGSEAERDELVAECLATGELIELNQQKLPGCYLHRSAPNDVARTEHLTFICTPTEGRRRAQQQLDGARGGATPS